MTGGCIVANLPIYVIIAPALLCLIPAALLFWYPGIGCISYRSRSHRDHFQCPLVPIVPLLGIGINIFMITTLRIATFVGFFIWMGVGLFIYFTYGLCHSRLVDENRKLLETDEDAVVMKILRH